MAKKKSIYDIAQQVYSLTQRAGGNPSRIRKIRDIGLRYMDNINRMKSQWNAFSKMTDSGSQEDFEKWRGVQGRKYARSTYMGLSNG